ncbi:hypothetical protein [Thalassotalea eurytherma]|uniref:ABC transporter ATP-binding protein n=1 Tax=Thalassotalea eurytherma TaxID=1144278 RepID=A0ABQ6H5H2_9GAMM|nr:hypothetical protein [Thalassotalea eurytherma]GLX83396.1 hypothetical protein theurythT_28490 [Thalassotalea eurytherma]
MKKEVVVASSLCVRFNNQTVLDDVNFSVGEGEVFALLDGNGALTSLLQTFGYVIYLSIFLIFICYQQFIEFC